MHTFVGIFSSNQPANRYKASVMLWFGKQAAAVSDTTRIQNNWQENIDSINKEQPKGLGDKMLPILLLSHSETWRLLPNSLVSVFLTMLTWCFKSCRTNLISLLLSRNYSINISYIICQLVAFSTAICCRSSIRCKETSPVSLVSSGWPLSTCPSGRSNIWKSWRCSFPKVPEFALLRTGEFNLMKTLNYVMYPCSIVVESHSLC